MKRISTILFALAAPFLLTGCLLMPGNFNAEMIAYKNGQFSFTYKGEIQMVGMQLMLRQWSSIAEKEGEEEAEFTAICYDEEGDFDVRDCTEEETEEQREEWQKNIDAKKKKAEELKETLGALLAGVDPEDPESINEFARGLTRMEGWNKVEHKGDGVFEVDYSIKGMLDRDYAFAFIPGYSMGEPLFYANRWTEGRVKFAAPTFRNNLDLNSLFVASAAGFSAIAPLAGEKGPTGISYKAARGTFTIKTDGEILTNNTLEGPKQVNGMNVMSWEVRPGSDRAPEALIKLAP
ncbi:hypothetical protein LPB140_05855 [Sphingorhabdus lutea]|uniref:Uncharacterized protein n=1 Tax=Sphingorhabdus lutea TaxID=1913578 RepID=A0A1L3JBA6_9SPHN|nr:hypothetical protein [Sphingorhabdus lutea]APG62398.1 hypothetical protein LPB140_05855 [Sphingorhabdus lutea]